jgi:catechol 2,3-dioxygenase-like lactoylglutathione lyase family enzyme
MSLEKVYGHLSCTDLERSRAWFETLFGRAPDAFPMAGLAEWHHRSDGGLQLFEDEINAGHNTLTLIVSGLGEEHDRLEQGGLHPGEIEPADTTSIVRLRDPDGNLVVLAEPRGHA